MLERDPSTKENELGEPESFRDLSDGDRRVPKVYRNNGEMPDGDRRVPKGVPGLEINK